MIRLRVPGSLTYRDIAVRTVAAACKLVQESWIAGSENGAGAKRERPPAAFDDEVISAFGEAFNNIAIHAYRGRPTGDVEIELDLDHDRLIIRLIDYGTSFDFTSVPAPDLDSLPEGGLGVFIIKSFMDGVEYTAGTPNVLALTKYLTCNPQMADLSSRPLE